MSPLLWKKKYLKFSLQSLLWGAETYNVAFVTHENFCNFETFIKVRFCYVKLAPLEMWDGRREGGKPERAELRNQIDVGSSVPPKSPSMSGDGKAIRYTCI